MLLGREIWRNRNLVFGSEIQLEPFGFTRLHAAILDLGTEDTAREMIIRTTPRDDIDEVDQTGRSALSWACAQNDLNMIDCSLRKGANLQTARAERLFIIYEIVPMSGASK